jgi:hypothetical protein
MDDVGDGLHMRYSSIVLEFLIRFLFVLLLFSLFPTMFICTYVGKGDHVVLF